MRILLIGLALLCELVPNRSFAEETTALSGLDLTKMKQGFGTPQINLSVDRRPLSIGGRAFAAGVGTHSPGSFFVALDGGDGTFHAFAGIDDETNKRGSATFTILGDGKTLWKSGVMRGGDPAKEISVSLKGIRVLALLVGMANDGYNYDHADWADAVFQTAGTAPVAIAPPTAPAPEIAPTAAPDKPILHCATQYGSLPSAPVFYDIAATGKPPLSFSASGLPASLHLNKTTGIITGTAPPKGETKFTLRVKNAHGSDSKTVYFAVGPKIGLLPPLGWNSYDSYNDSVTEAETLANAQWLKTNLQPYGWDYVIVDFRWYDPAAGGLKPADRRLTMDANGRLLPSPNRFPSAANGQGFKPLADKVHAMGLKFGIHIMRGMARQAFEANAPIENSAFHAADAGNPGSVCPWNQDMYGVRGDTAAGQAWYDSLMRQYAGWGLDYIKMDDASRPYAAAEIAAVRKAIDKCGRSIVFSLSPGETPVAQAKHALADANLWRISDDFWDNWSSLNRQFDLLTSWKGNALPGAWPDADMIPFAHLGPRCPVDGINRQTRFTKNEQLLLMTLWAIAPSPLMLGMNLPDNDAFTTALLTNSEVLAINQDALMKQGTRVPQDEDTEIWTKPLANGDFAVALFNRGEVEQNVAATAADLGLTGKRTVRDVWKKKNLDAFDKQITIHLPPHGAALLRFSK